MGEVPADAATAAALPTSYSAHVALELDYDFYKKFPDQTRAIQYAMDLLAFTGTIGKAELGRAVNEGVVRHAWVVLSEQSESDTPDR